MEENGGTATTLGIGLALVLLIVILPVVLFTGTDQQTPDPLSPCTLGAEPVLASGTPEPVGIPEPYRDALTDAAQVSGLPTALLAAQIQQESGWDPREVSPAGARGMAQFMPGTWTSWGNGADPFDPFASLNAQGRYMKYLLEKVAPLATSENERIRFALAAYNAGEGNVRKYGGIPPFSETRNYVETIMNNAQLDFSSTCQPPGGFAYGDLGPGQWVNPVPGAYLISDYGPRPCPLGSCVGKPYLLDHEGIDLTGGSEYFYAPTDMEITYASTGPTDSLYGSYGNYLFARQTEAPHLVFEFHEAADGSLLVNTGDMVSAGTPLGRQGRTGNSSGIHLHFQINRPDTTTIHAPAVNDDASLDPMPYLRAKGISFT